MSHEDEVILMSPHHEVVGKGPLTITDDWSLRLLLPSTGQARPSPTSLGRMPFGSISREGQ